ncbi:uncharacterized protein LOC108088505 isoform X2 [Drosophila ficusphila]|nr:uncharacterized protein LOC108088505 isoform X2 [Drosophila ficusphila]
MLFKALTFFVAIGAVYGAVVPAQFEVEAETQLIQLLLSSPALRSAEFFNLDCFDYYTPLLKQHADKYEEDSRACYEVYERAFEEIDGSYSDPRNELSNSVRDICVSLLTCDAKGSNSDAFDCLAEEGPSKSSALDSASDQAADYKSSLTLKIREIDNTRSACLTTATRTYRTNHAQCVEDMGTCASDPNWQFPATVIDL